MPAEATARKEELESERGRERVDRMPVGCLSASRHVDSTLYIREEAEQSQNQSQVSSMTPFLSDKCCRTEVEIKTSVIRLQKFEQSQNTELSESSVSQKLEQSQNNSYVSPVFHRR